MAPSLEYPLESQADVSVRGLRKTVTLLPHQKSGVSWMRNRESGDNIGGIIADEMGYELQLPVSCCSVPFLMLYLQPWKDNPRHYKDPRQRTLFGRQGAGLCQSYPVCIRPVIHVHVNFISRAL